MHKSKLMRVHMESASCLARHASVKTCSEMRGYGVLYLCCSLFGSMCSENLIIFLQMTLKPTVLNRVV
jgi:hypothetical protein